MHVLGTVRSWGQMGVNYNYIKSDIKMPRFQKYYQHSQRVLRNKIMSGKFTNNFY